MSKDSEKINEIFQIHENESKEKERERSQSFSKVHNYGDEICAYSDLGSLLNQIRSYHETISPTLLDATNALYDTVMNTVIDSTMITPTTYGSGIAVFNPQQDHSVVDTVRRADKIMYVNKKAQGTQMLKLIF